MNDGSKDRYGCCSAIALWQNKNKVIALIVTTSSINVDNNEMNTLLSTIKCKANTTTNTNSTSMTKEKQEGEAAEERLKQEMKEDDDVVDPPQLQSEERTLKIHEQVI